MYGVKICSGRTIFCSAFDDGLVTKYELGKWTVRTNKHGPFAVFDTILNAKRFLKSTWGKNYYKSLIYSKSFFLCEYDESKEKELYFIYQCFGDVGTKKMLHSNIPKGTIFADRVKLIKKL